MKKILLYSLVISIVIILTSITSVVGFLAEDSKSNYVSPLFNIRIKKSIYHDYKDVIDTDYIGKREGLSILIPKLNDKAILVERFIDRISNMNDIKDNWIINKINIANKDKIISALQYIRDHTGTINDFFSNENRDSPETIPPFTTKYVWAPGCLIQEVIAYILSIISSFISFI